MFNKSNAKKNEFQLTGSFRKKGYDWWWHSFTAKNEKTGEEKPFFFEFFIINPSISPNKIQYGRKGETPSYLMVKAGAWGKDHTQLHRFFPLNNVKLKAKAPFSIEADDCFLNNEISYGHIKVNKEEALSKPELMSDYGEIEWNLHIKKEISFNVGYGTSWILRKLKAFEMYWHAEGIKTKYEGTIIFNGEKYIINPDNSFGYADKNWGRNFTSPWVWLASCDLSSNITHKKLLNTAFDIGGGRPKVFFVPLNKILLGGFYYQGKEYEFNFSKFWTGAKTKFDCRIEEKEVVWHVEMVTRKAKLIIDSTCKKEDMLLVNYESPDGKKRHNNLYNGGNGEGRILLYSLKGKKETLIDDMNAKHIGCEFGEYDHE